MSDLPFGFGLPDDSDPDKPSVPGIPGFSSGDLGEALQQIGRLLSAGGGDDGPVNWTLAEETARQAVVAGGDPSVSAEESRLVTEAVRLAETWLDAATTFPAASDEGLAWSRSEWITGSLPVWKQVVEPIATAMAAAQEQAIPEQMRSMAGPMLGMVRQLGGAMFGLQLGQGLAEVAATVLTGTEIGLPLGPDRRSVLLPRNIAEHGEAVSIPLDEVRLDLALREASLVRLFTHVPWLRQHVVDCLVAAAATVQIDPDRLSGLLGGVDPSDPTALADLLSSGALEPQDTPQRRVALEELATVLAVLAGWVEVVVAEAAGDRLPHAAALAETARRRRAAAGPAEQALNALVGLEPDPLAVRQAAAIWRALGDDHGIAARDERWTHANLLPSAADLEEPDGYLAAAAPVEIPDDLSGLDDL